jgi:hypothetical protein
MRCLDKHRSLGTTEVGWGAKTNISPWTYQGLDLVPRMIMHPVSIGRNILSSGYGKRSNPKTSVSYGTCFIPIISFLAHLSWKLKWAFPIASCPSSVRPSVYPSVYPSKNFYIFDFFPRTTGSICHSANFNKTWHKSSLRGGDSSLFKWRGLPLSKGIYNSETVKIHWNFLKIFFSRTSCPNSIKLSTNYSWVKHIQICSNKGSGPLQKGDNYENVKMGWGHLKIFFSTITCPEKLKFTWKLSDILENQVC